VTKDLKERYSLCGGEEIGLVFTDRGTNTKPGDGTHGNLRLRKLGAGNGTKKRDTHNKEMEGR
jgi:hypothetical protein